MKNAEKISLGMSVEDIHGSLEIFQLAIDQLATLRETMDRNNPLYYQLGGIRELIRDGRGPMLATYQYFVDAVHDTPTTSRR